MIKVGKMPKFNASEQYINGFLDGIIRISLASCRNENNYEMTAKCLKDEPDTAASLAEELGCEEKAIELLPSDISLEQICRECFGNDRKSRRAIAGLADMLRQRFGAEKEICVLGSDAQIRDDYSGYGGGNAPFYIVSRLFIIHYANGSVLFIIGSDE